MQDGPPPDDDAEGARPLPPPADLPAERYVLGAVIQSELQLSIVQPLLRGSHFYNVHHETIWETICELAKAEQPTEPQALLAALQERGTLQKVGGGPYLHSLIAEATHPSNATHYARRVAQLARRRAALTAARQAVQRLSAPGPADETDEALAATAAAINATVEALADPNPTTTWGAVDLAAALEGRSLDPPPDMCARTDGVCLFYSGAVHTIAGEPESGKTWVALYTCTQLLAAHMPVVFIDFEDRPERVVGRLLALGATTEQVRDHFTYVRPDRSLDLEGQQALAYHLTHAMLVVIDGVTEAMSLHGLELNSNEDAATFYGLLPRWIADHGPAVVMIDHVVKDPQNRGRYALGAQHKLAGIDGAAYSVKAVQRFGRTKRGVAHIAVQKDRAGHVREHARGDHIADFILDDTGRDSHPAGPRTMATLEPPEEHLGDDGFEPTVLMAKLWHYVHTHPGLSKRAIYDAIPGKQKAKQLGLEILISKGHITIETGPNRSLLHHPGPPYPPAPEEQDGLTDWHDN